MKKRMFRMLCVVLALALLAPNVFAATPAPEVPLADEATVIRVKNEIATGEITDMEDLFLVAYQHLGADLEEEGMTAYINEDGTLGFTQVISNSTDNGDVSLCSTDDVVEEKTYVVSTLGLFNVESGELTYIEYEPQADTVHCSVNGTNVVIVHSAYYNGSGDVSSLNPDLDIRISHMVTTITGADGAHYVTRLVQKYEHLWFGVPTEEDTKITTNVYSGSYYFTPSNRTWYQTYCPDPECLKTTVEVYIAGVNTPAYLETVAELCENTPPHY